MGEQRFGQRLHWFSSFMVFLGTWASGYFIIATNAWVQHPVGYTTLENGNIVLDDYWAVLFNPWVFPQYAHNMGGAVVCGSFVMAGLGAFYVLGRRHEEYGRVFLKVGVIAGTLASLWMLFPSGHFSSEQVAEHQPVSLAAMEGLFESEKQAGVVLIGQPDLENRTIDNPIVIPRALSYLVYQNWDAEVKGLEAFPEKNWPDNIPLLYYSYHVMVGLGSIFIGIMVLAALLLWRGKLYEFRPMEVKDPEKPLSLPKAFNLEFDQVCFRYEDDGPLVLEDISFTLEPGKRVAVVGPSGAGKSTLANLVLRFWDPNTGRVALGGHDVRGYDQDGLRGLVGVVSQDTHVFNDTLRGNLLLARPEATDAELRRVVERSQLADLAERLPGGLDSPLGEQGLKLSGGERQRLSVARTLLKDAPLLVLDEPTANLDPVTERELLDAVYELVRDRATLVITHRLVRMEGMDEILVLDGGRVVERGNHDELVSMRGVYRRMLDVQRGLLAVH